jgi:signal transduction histidine kinase/ActR/RegA family two-component response regulator
MSSPEEQTPPSNSFSNALKRPPLAFSVILAVLMVVAVALMRLHVAAGHVTPLGLSIPLVACILFRSRAILVGMFICFTAISIWQYAYNWHPDVHLSGNRWETWATSEFNMLMLASVIYYVISARERSFLQNDQLQLNNSSLANRDNQITEQNRQLQSQGQELVRQSQELERQGEELRVSNTELETRENILERLLALSQGLTIELTRQQIMQRICAALDVLVGGQTGGAVAFLERQANHFVVLASFGGAEMVGFVPAEKAFASIVLERGEIGYVADLSLRPELQIPRPADGLPMQSILAAPLRLPHGRAGALEIYTRQPHAWTKHEISVIEALAAQASISLSSAALIEELEKRRHEAEEASLRKTRFLAAVSHDIRTPANAINLIAELMMNVTRSVADKNPEDSSAAELPTMANDLRGSALSLVQLVSDVLDVTRYDYGKIEMQISEFPLPTLLAELIRQYRSEVQNKGLSLSSEETDGVVLRADRVKLGRVISNLLGNALKFTDHGGVLIRAMVRPDGCAVLSVSDTGPGIAREHQQHIFDEFYQVKNPARDRTQGTGLGLAICKRLVEAMDGTLQVVSDIGRGAAFTVTLPANMVVSSPTKSTAAPANNNGNGERDDSLNLRILLVEDHEVTRLAVAHILRRQGAKVIEAATAAAAFDRLADSEPEAMLLDMMLPDQDGREVLRHMQANGRPASLQTVLVLTGDVTPERSDEVQRLGADGLLHKPIDPAAVINFLRERRQPAVA